MYIVLSFFFIKQFFNLSIVFGLRTSGYLYVTIKQTFQFCQNSIEVRLNWPSNCFQTITLGYNSPFRAWLTMNVGYWVFSKHCLLQISNCLQLVTAGDQSSFTFYLPKSGNNDAIVYQKTLLYLEHLLCYWSLNLLNGFTILFLPRLQLRWQTQPLSDSWHTTCSIKVSQHSAAIRKIIAKTPLEAFGWSIRWVSPVR